MTIRAETRRLMQRLSVEWADRHWRDVETEYGPPLSRLDAVTRWEELSAVVPSDAATQYTDVLRYLMHDHHVYFMRHSGGDVAVTCVHVAEVPVIANPGTEHEVPTSRVFASGRERRLWCCILAVLVAIFSTLEWAPAWAARLGGSGWGAGAFALGVLLVGAVVLSQGLTRRPDMAEGAVALAVGTVYLLVFARMAVVTERSHLIEYGVVAVLTYEALLERQRHARCVPWPAVLAILGASAMGVLDECVQWILPSRVFELQDILFNVLAAVMAVVASVALSRARAGSP